MDTTTKVDITPAQQLLQKIRTKQRENIIIRQQKHDANVIRYRAAVGNYKKILFDEVTKELDRMADDAHAWARLYNIETMIKEQTLDGIKVHNLHYGFFNNYWTKRNPLSTLDPSITQPFPEVQTELAKDGYYLVDISNPEKSYEVRIGLYIDVDQYKRIASEELWHGLNRVPESKGPAPMCSLQPEETFSSSSTEEDQAEEQVDE